MKSYIKTIVLIIFFILSIISSVKASTDFSLQYNLNRLPNMEKFNLSEVRTDISLPEFHVKGIYVTGWVAGNESKINDLIALVDKTILNAMVIDIKDQQGYLSYQSSVELSQKIEANRGKIKDIKSLLIKLKEHNIYTIGRIVVFKDSLLSVKRPDLSLPLWDPDGQAIIYDRDWLDPAAKEVWDYNIQLAKEAIELGFDEIQFDYIRFPAMAHSPKQVILPAGATKSDCINSFLGYALEELKSYAVPISIDVFGLTTTVNDDLGIGQNFRDLAKLVPIISPMVYPSHYSPGSYGLPLPVSQPYQVIYRSMLDALEKTAGNEEVIIRPWLQDFSLNYKYTQREVLEQIAAAEELGIKEWLLWNPRSQYTEEALLNYSPPN